MYNSTTIEHWLEHISEWCNEVIHYLDSFQRSFRSTGELNADADDWSVQLSQLRSNAKQQLSAIREGGGTIESNFAIEQLAQQATNLNRQLSQDLQQSIDPSIPEEDVRPSTQTVPIGGHVVPPLPYRYNALEPYIDEQTMRLHHDKLHRNYVEGLNKAEKEMLKARESGDYSLIRHWEREAAFNGAGHYLHTIFWYNMKPQGGGPATGEVAGEINKSFGSFDKFKEHFSAAAEKVEGPGWAILVWSPRSGRMEILQAEKHQNLSQQDIIPLLVLDVWEHSYLLKYKEDRKAYIKAWWNVVNWQDVNERFRQARTIHWQPF